MDQDIHDWIMEGIDPVEDEEVVCELCGKLSIPGTLCLGDIFHDRVD